MLVLAKIAAHWLVTGLPLLLVAPLLAVFLGLPNHALSVLLLTLLLGTPVLSLIGAIGVALTVGLRRGGLGGNRGPRHGEPCGSTGSWTPWCCPERPR